MKENQKNQKSEKVDLDQYLLLPIFFILLIFATVESRAEESLNLAVQVNAVQASASDLTTTPAEKKIEVEVAIEHSSNLMADSNPDKDESTSLIIKPAYTFSEKSNLAGRIDLKQDYDSQKTLGTSNAVLLYQITSMELNNDLSFMPILAFGIPTDKAMRDNESYRGTLSFRPTLAYESPIKGLSVVNQLMLNKLFHEYEYKRDFSANNELTIRNRFIVSYKINEKWKLELLNDYVKAWTYNRYTNDAFYFSQELSHSFMKDWGVYVSHKNEGSARGPNNNGDNVAFYDAASSYVSLGISHIF